MTSRVDPTRGMTATVEPKGAKFVHRFYVDGELRDTRTSAHRYSFVRVQRWEGSDEPDDFAPRYSRTPGKIGSKIEYGYCAGNVEIANVAACPTCARADCRVEEKFMQATRHEPMKSLGFHGYCPTCECSFAVNS